MFSTIQINECGDEIVFSSINSETTDHKTDGQEEKVSRSKENEGKVGGETEGMEARKRNRTGGELGATRTGGALGLSPH